MNTSVRMVAGCGLLLLCLCGGSPTQAPSPTAPALQAGEALRLLGPNGGERFRVGDTVTITWLANFDELTNGVVPGITPDNGLTWLHLYPTGHRLVQRADTLYDGNRGTWRWRIPATMTDDFGATVSLVSDSCRFGVHAIYDRDTSSARGWRMDQSDGLIAITAR